MTDTDTYDVEFSDVDSNPGTPTTNPSNWFDPDTDTSKDFTQMLWRAERECVNGTWGSWTIVRIKGEKGDKGDQGDQGNPGTNAPYIELSRTSILYQANNSGYSVAAQDFPITAYLKVNGQTCSISSVSNITVSVFTGVTATKNSTSSITISVTHSKIMAGVVTIEMTGTYGGKTYTAKGSITIEPNYEGAQGPQGDQGPTGPQGPQGPQGNQGGQGNRGPALRGPQDWNLCTENGTEAYQFYQGAEGEPYIDFVIYNGYFYVCKKSYTSASILPTNTTYWTLADKVAMIAASVLFAEHGYFGDAIISGSWLISANGTIDGVAYTKGQKFQNELAYNLFNADSPLGIDIQRYYSEAASTISSSNATLNKATVSLEAGRVYLMNCAGYTSNTSHPLYVRLVKTDDSSVVVTPINLNTTSSAARSGYAHITQSGTYYIQLYHDTGYTGTLNMCKIVEKCFAPYYALNLKNGKVYQVDAYLRGGMRSPFTYLGRGSTFANDFSDNVAVYSASQSTYALPWSTDQSGRKVTITNYYWNGSYSTASGYAEITAPTGKYFYEDGVTKSSIKLSREAVELLGYGDTSTFYGWIVLKRIDLGTQNRYGHPMKMLANGRVTGTSSGASIIYHTFDGTTLTVTRNSQGRYTITWNNANWFAGSSHVFAIATGFGNISHGTNPVWAQVESQTTTSITIRTADDSSLNDGSFNFFIMNFNDWIYL